MGFTINGFCNQSEHTAPRKSLVRVRFPGKNTALSYYNDAFDLKVGDRVFVEGTLEGQLGRVVEVSYSFKIKLSDYRKVIALADTDVHGQFYMALSHFVTFDRSTLPAAQAAGWFKPPVKEDEEIIVSCDDSSFPLEKLEKMDILPTIAERGHEYYLDNRVRYLSLDGEQGFAIVEGSEHYAVQFRYRDGLISQLVCDCPCVCTCKHEFAAMLQLRETLEQIEKHYAEDFKRSGYFAAVFKGTLFCFAIDGKETGSFTL